MANITPYINNIQNAVYGEEVRSSIISALELVNDDNESYADIKQDILDTKDDIDEQVEAFDDKVTAAQTVISTLETDTATANTAKTNLETTITNAGTAQSNLEDTIDDAEDAQSDLETATTNATTATTNANTATTNANTATTNANTAKTNLDASITSAETAKTNLDNSVSTAATSKTNLETAISNAATAKSNLEGTISDSEDERTDLAAAVSAANTAKTNLETATTNGNTLYQSLYAENASAASNIAELRSENFNAQEILAGVTDLRAYLGIITEDVVGLQVDYENKTFTRLAGASGKSAGSDFDGYTMYGGRKLCNVADDGTIVAWYGDNDYAEDGSMGQVMVYQPKFYYLVAPIEYEAQDTGIGYHLRKANYYVCEKARAGFRLHPAFYDVNGDEIDYYLRGSYEGCLYDTSASAYIDDDDQVMTVAEDKFSSIAGVKPASGSSQSLTRPNVETMAQNRGSGFHSDLIKLASAEQLLMMIELGTMNTQTAVGTGVASYASGSGNEASDTGSTASIGEGTGQATSTRHVASDGTVTTDTTAGKLSIRYRGVENFWSNIWAFIYGVNIYGNGNMAGGQPYICDDFNFAESKNSDNYTAAGFTLANASGYISAMGYSTAYDWLFMPSECSGNSSLPVGDYTWITSNLNAYRIARLGGGWDGGAFDGGFCWNLSNGVGNRSQYVGGRLVYVPTATDTDYQDNIDAWETVMNAA